MRDALNKMKGDFTQGAVGEKGMRVDDFLKEKKIDFVDLLHVDIQGAELEMLFGAEKSIKEGKIGYAFISTHSQSLHEDCLKFLKNHDFDIIASADFEIARLKIIGYG